MKEATPVNVLGSAGSIPTVKHRALGGAAGAPPLTASRYQSHGGKHTGHLAQDGARLPSWQDETDRKNILFRPKEANLFQVRPLTDVNEPVRI